MEQPLRNVICIDDYWPLLKLHTIKVIRLFRFSTFICNLYKAYVLFNFKMHIAIVGAVRPFVHHTKKGNGNGGDLSIRSIRIRLLYKQFHRFELRWRSHIPRSMPMHTLVARRLVYN